MEQLHSWSLIACLENEDELGIYASLASQTVWPKDQCCISNSSLPDAFVTYSKNELLQKPCAWLLTMSNGSASL